MKKEEESIGAYFAIVSPTMNEWSFPPAIFHKSFLRIQLKLMQELLSVKLIHLREVRLWGCA